MIGVFDSGEGGLCAVDEIKRLCPECDIIFHADKENAPYGTKTKSELIKLVKRDIKILRDGGADKILIACCTASTVYPMLSDVEREICLPIIKPTAILAAEATKRKRVGIICTAATAKSGCFECEITKINSKIQTKALPLGELVTLVEDGASDTSHTVRDAVKIKKMLEPIKDFNPDVLILGCTHFSRVGKIISQALPGVKLIDSAKTGAREILARHGHGGTGKFIYV